MNWAQNLIIAGISLLSSWLLTTIILGSIACLCICRKYDLRFWPEYKKYYLNIDRMSLWAVIIPSIVFLILGITLKAFE